jgi:eukaryotic-like serine/threonine-protein kinase
MSPTFSPGARLGHYEIKSQIGAGGMGEVYLAQDTKLDRKVAIKFLNEEFSRDSDKLNRFIQEAKAASALNHPNILTVYEVGEVDGKNYISTELIDGQTLRELISQKEALQLKPILKIGVQVAEALSAAHQAGIIHRDIKPENIMIRRDGYAKVLDFGLAKLSEPKAIATGSEDATRVQVNTTPGMVMGTVSYMSPEQARGNVTDARTDVWSLGVVLYEMLAGKVPFTGETVNHTIVSILEKEPLLLENVPAELQRIVRKSMTKDVDMRYQSARDLLIDLKNLRRDLDIQGELERSIVPNRETANASLENATQMYAADVVAATSGGQAAATRSLTTSSSSLEYAVTQAKSHKLTTAIIGILLVGVISAAGYFAFVSRGGSTKQISSIAVMPFVNESGNAEVEYLSDGMTETLITSLSQIPNLNVKARSSVFRYKGKETDPRTIGKELSVQAVLNGRVAQRGDDLTLNLELVDVQTENVIWSEQYNRKQTDLVSLQSDIARDVSSKLKIKLSGADEQKLTKNYTQNAEAYKLYLQGRFYANKRTPKDARKAIDCFQQAVRIDSNYAIAYGGLAISYTYLTIYGDDPASETFPKALEFATKARELDSTLAEPHLILGLLKFLSDHDFAGWERESQLALTANPNSTDAHRLNGFRLLFLGRFEEALAEVQRSLEIEPLSTAGNINYSYALFYSGRVDESEAQTKKAIELAPDFWLSHYYLYNVYRFKGNYAQAAEELAKSKDLRDETEAAKLIRESFAKGGWQGCLRAVTVEHAPMKMTAYNMAGFYAETGDKDRAFAALNEAIDKSDQFIGFVKIDPFMKPLRDDPRFQPLLKRIGFPN